jgi:hypothetical protein
MSKIEVLRNTVPRKSGMESGSVHELGHLCWGTILVQWQSDDVGAIRRSTDCVAAAVVLALAVGKLPVGGAVVSVVLFATTKSVAANNSKVLPIRRSAEYSETPMPMAKETQRKVEPRDVAGGQVPQRRGAAENQPGGGAGRKPPTMIIADNRETFWSSWLVGSKATTPEIQSVWFLQTNCSWLMAAICSAVYRESDLGTIYALKKSK